jgi:hypothetical protein
MREDEIVRELRELERMGQQQQQARKQARRNRRYVFAVVFNENANQAADYNEPAVPKTVKVTVDRPFYAAELQACVRVVGSIASQGVTTNVFDVPLGVAAQITNGNLSTYADGLFDFFWSLRDSFGDREWTKGKQPSGVLESSVLGGLALPKRQYCPAGTEISLDIEPLYVFIGTVTGEGYSITTKSFTVEFSIVGYEL